MDKYVDQINQDYVKFCQKTDKQTIKQVLEYLSAKYYNDEGVVSDEAFDYINDCYGNLFTIGAEVAEGKVKLPIHMGSMYKIKHDNEKKLQHFLTKFTNPKCISEKLDGVSFLIANEHGVINAYTRGDGTFGQNATVMLKFLHLDHAIQNLIEICDDKCYVRGKIIISKNDWTQLETDSKNARNYVSGKVNKKSTNPDDYIGLQFVAYEYISSKKLSISKQLALLNGIGFKTVVYEILPKVNQDILKKKLIEFRQKSEFEIDGIIIQDNRYYPRNTSMNPEYARAFKMDGSTYSTNVIGVEWNPSKSGKLKPIVIIEPVKILDDSGKTMATIRKTTGYNAKFIVENGIGPGANINIVRSGDVIPKIISVNNKTKASFPKIPFYWDDNGTDILVELEEKDDAYHQIQIKKIGHFISQTGIEFYKASTIEKGYNIGLDSIEKIITATKDDFLKIEGIQDKSSRKIHESIRKSLTNIPFVKLAAALPYFDAIGTRRLEAIYEKIPNLLELIEYPEILYTKLMSVDGIADKMAQIIIDGLPHLVQFIKFFEKYHTIQYDKIQPKNLDLDGKVFVFSGKRNQKIEDDIISRGGKIGSGVNKHTSYLVLENMESVSKKTTKAKSLNVPIILFSDLPSLLK